MPPEGGIRRILVIDDEPCDLVLLDLRLPDLDGEEFLRRLRRERPRQAVVTALAI